MAPTAGKKLIFDIRPAIESLELDRVIEQVGLDRIIEQVGAKLGEKELMERLLAKLSPAARKELKRRL